MLLINYMYNINKIHCLIFALKNEKIRHQSIIIEYTAQAMYSFYMNSYKY